MDFYIIGADGFGRKVIWLVIRINDVTPTWNIKDLPMITKACGIQSRMATGCLSSW